MKFVQHISIICSNGAMVKDMIVSPLLIADVSKIPPNWKGQRKSPGVEYSHGSGSHRHPRPNKNCLGTIHVVSLTVIGIATALSLLCILFGVFFPHHRRG